MPKLPCEIIAMALDALDDALSLPRVWRLFSNDGERLVDNGGSYFGRDFVVWVISRGNNLSLYRYRFSAGHMHSGDFRFAVSDSRAARAKDRATEFVDRCEFSISSVPGYYGHCARAMR